MVAEGACSSLRGKKIEYNANKTNVFVTTFVAHENDRAEMGSLAPLLRGLLVPSAAPDVDFRPADWKWAAVRDDSQQ
jgi:hypothetical protein